MAVAKTIEIISSSSESIEAAVRDGIAKAAESVTGIEGAWVQDTKVIVRDNRVAEWRVTLKITFVVA
jgi:flavin-binding protein dodecin